MGVRLALMPVGLPRARSRWPAADAASAPAPSPVGDTLLKLAGLRKAIASRCGGGEGGSAHSGGGAARGDEAV